MSIVELARRYDAEAVDFTVRLHPSIVRAFRDAAGMIEVPPALLAGLVLFRSFDVLSDLMAGEEVSGVPRSPFPPEARQGSRSDGRRPRRRRP